MIRDNYQLTLAMTTIYNALKAGNEKALHDIPQQFIDLLDTLRNDPDKLSGFQSEKSIRQLQMDNRYLNDQLSVLQAKHNETQDTLKKMGEELDKFRKIFSFMMEQKEAKTNEETK